MQDRIIKGVARLMFLLLVSSGTMAFTHDAVRPEPSAEAAAQSVSRVRILTWNLKGGPCGSPRAKSLNMKHFKQAIDQYDPATLILQEVHKDQADLLADFLGKSYTVYFVPTQSCSNKTAFGDAFVSRLKMTNLHAESLHPIDQDAARRHEFVKVSAVTIEVNGKPLRLYNVHLSARDPVHRNGERLRDLQVQFILRLVNADARRFGKTFKPVVAGDFNTPPTGPYSGPYSRMRKEFKDAWAEGNQAYFDRLNPNGWTERNSNGRLQRIDYLFLGLNADIKVEQAGVIGTPFLTDPDNNLGLSDHRPVIAYLAY